MIRTQDLEKDYGSLPAVRDVNIHVREGECCVLLGPSGCGKSTLLKMINALVSPTAGDIFVNGKSIRQTPPELLRRGIGYVVQNVGLFPHYTVRRNVSVVPELLKWPRQKTDRRVDFLLDLMGLPGSIAAKRPHELSGGEAQRVGVARALAADPPILLMDEPFGSVDPLNRERLQRSFAEIQRSLKKTVLFVTHDVSEALMLADRILLMREGRMVRSGTPRDMVLGGGDAFSRAFFGSETALKLLSRYRTKEAFQPGAVPTEAACAVPASAPLSEALAFMLVHGCPLVTVTDRERAAGSLSFDSLIAFLKGAPTDARRD